MSSEPKRSYAIKRFKPDREGDHAHHAGISQSACREISLCRELSHQNIVGLREVLLDPTDKSINMVFEYAEHDLLVCFCRNHQARTKNLISVGYSKFYIIMAIRSVNRSRNIPLNRSCGN